MQSNTNMQTPPTQSNATHTATPYYDESTNRESANVVAAGSVVAHVYGKKDRAFIVRACNSHEALVEALSAMYCAGLWSVDGYASLPAHQRAAIDKARVILSNITQ